MAGYTRNDTSNNIANGNIIDADDLDGEFNAIETAFGAISGHTHDGTTGNGAPITRVGPAQDLTVSATQVLPKTNNVLDLGSSTFKFKDAYVDGIVYADGITFNGTAITATALELNKLAGATPTTAEINRLTGVTSPIQTQLDNKQALDAELTALAGLVSAADRLPYFTGVGTAALATFTSFGRSLVDDVDAAAGRTTLGLGSIATQAANSVAITGGSITGITALAVADGGTGVSTITGIIRGNGTSPFTAAVAGTDFLAPAAIGTTVQAFDANLSAVAGLSTNGFIARTGAGTAAARTITAGSRISVTNGDGVSGNPTIAVGTLNLATTDFAAATLVTEAEGLNSSDNDTSIPTTAAVKDYVDVSINTGVASLFDIPEVAGEATTTLTGLDDFSSVEVRVIIDGIPSNGSRTAVLQYSTDGGSSWSAGTTIATNNTSGGVRQDPSWFIGTFDFTSGQLRGIQHTGSTPSVASSADIVNTTVAGASLAINAVRVLAASNLVKIHLIGGREVR